MRASNIGRQPIENRGKIFNRDDPINAAWPDNVHVAACTVDVHISRLGKTLKTISPRNVIRTIRSAGCALDELDQ
ncbi:hypothetical protein ORS3428_22280 [Mesorhizobium sp. ORS 3428]|nr:hypothetical protein ORS3428_22280 [Mesorhizobium sp. ORS 3428]